jgi:outer membrane protein OmpA-like peptidoglycan-associated protein
MSRIYVYIFILIAPLFFTACQLQMPSLGVMAPSQKSFGVSGDESFRQHLVVEYRALADFEEKMLGDAKGAQHFSNKALKASAGFSVGPDEIQTDIVPKDALPALKEARASLVDALDVMKTEQNEPFLALAQSKFDCWLALQTDYPEYVNNFVCQQHFYIAMKFLIAPPMETGQYVVYFDSGSTSLDDESMEALKAAVREYKQHPGWLVVLNGYTDGKGDRFTNEILARRRAIAVKNMLGQQGIDIENVEVSAIGESESTDEEDDRHSRRVEIEIVPRYSEAADS